MLPRIPCLTEPLGGECAGVALLFVENHHAYESLVNWNERCRRYRAIVYGAGNAASKPSVCGEAGFESHLDRIMRRVGALRIEYLGDLDPRGIEIPALRDRDRREAGLCGIEPAADFYRWLLARGQHQPMNDSQARRAVTVIEDTGTWLGWDLCEAVRELWSGGMRIAQESLGTHALDEGAPGAI